MFRKIKKGVVIMKYFYESDFDDYINGDDGEKRVFNKRNCYMFTADDNNNSIVVNDSNNHIPSMEELKTIMLGLTRFINTYSQESIDDYNLSVDQHVKKQEEQSKIELTQKEKTRPGYVYFIADNMNNIKIGLSKDMGSRFKNYTEMPYNPEIIHLLKCSDMVKVEAYFHEKFADKRFKGEWFKLVPKDIKYIKAGRYSEEIMKFIV
jgi:predicted GIY-YIG superfamily endonuclease